MLGELSEASSCQGRSDSGGHDVWLERSRRGSAENCKEAVASLGVGMERVRNSQDRYTEKQKKTIQEEKRGIAITKRMVGWQQTWHSGLIEWEGGGEMDLMVGGRLDWPGAYPGAFTRGREREGVGPILAPSWRCPV